MELIPLLDAKTAPVTKSVPSNASGPIENWYAEPFTKRTGCKVPGQCGGDCNCGCPYNTMTDVEQLPLIEEIAAIFPNEWLAFITSATDDEEYEPIHGKLVAHSPQPDELFDAVNTVLWNQHVYVYFNGDFEAMQRSYGPQWEEPIQVKQRTFSGPKQVIEAAAALADPLPESLLDLVYSVIDQLTGQPNLNEAIRRLRLSRVRAANSQNQPLIELLDLALDRAEGSLPRVNEIVWLLEDGLAELDLNRI